MEQPGKMTGRDKWLRTGSRKPLLDVHSHKHQTSTEGRRRSSPPPQPNLHSLPVSSFFSL